MNLIFSPKGIVNATNPKRGFAAMERAGMQHAVMDFSICDKEMKEEVACGIHFPIAIASSMDMDAPSVDKCAFLEQCIRECKKFNCPYLVIPALPMEAALRVAHIAREQGVMLLLKNECGDRNGHLVRGAFCDAKEAAEYVDELNGMLDAMVFGFCLDVGVCNLCGQNMLEFVSTLGSRLEAVIVRDNDGREDVSLLPFSSIGANGLCTDWRNLILGLRKIKFDGMVIMEFGDSMRFAPVPLRARYLELFRDVGAYFQWQLTQGLVVEKYGSRVLFGAGNMCRNYMKEYGEKFPPLFTCDNNRALWGTRVEGLEVKSPEALRELPKDCAIFICNIYYEEITRQLREMKLENPIEYFNDEWRTLCLR